MKKLLNVMLMACVIGFTVSCNDNDDNPKPPVAVDPNGAAVAPNEAGLNGTVENGRVVLQGSATKNVILRAGTKYILKGFVYIPAGLTLTIEPGTVIMGDKTTKGTLVIERGGKIMADGTAQKPIVFTSAQQKGSRAAGDWGGIIVLGAAPTNLPSEKAKIEGGVDREYGGTNANDNSGIIRYVRIEFSGIAFQPDNEINGLTLGGVGAGTTIDYVQVSYNGDDSFEMFGGTVNMKHLIAYKTVDDMFDTDNGYSGKLQFVVGLSNPAVADVSGSNGFESDGDAQGSDASPKTSAIFSNVSLFGPMATSTATGFNSNFKRAMHIRRNSNIQVHNAVFAGWPTGLLLDGSKSQANATANTLKIQNTVIAGSQSGKALTTETGSTFDVSTWFNAASKGNSVVAEAADLKLNGAFNQQNPDFRPGSGSSLLSGASFTGLDAFFENVAYKGAFGTTDWTAGWANFDPQNTDY
ncbi:T9SS C-terminal target domain-containing protein [Adhaeribacter terreus]|uniref:T9SS C-terminal target domain-containing protein n=1 Tax=Adhaeribacter terreus TaxID=529703 RepID=A0ABW0EC22_9BACT